jgi:uncharacterized protein with gpF-like domain
MSAFDRRRKQFERNYQRKIEKELRRYGKSIALQIKQGTAPETFLLSGQFLSRQKLNNIVNNLWNNTGNYFITYSHNRLRRTGINTPKVNDWGQTVDNYFETQGAAKINTIVKNQEEQIRSIINETVKAGQEEGLGVVKISDNITKELTDPKFKHALKSRFNATRIARTEIASASSQANAEQIGLVKGGFLRWETAQDASVRGRDPRDQADHISLQGVQIPNDGKSTFPNGLRYPHDPSARNPAEVINCRCSVRWVPE